MLVRVGCRFALALLACTGCAVRRPLMVRDQAKLNRTQAKILQPYAEQVQAELKSSAFTVALVIVDQDTSRPLAIYPTNDPVATAADHFDRVSQGRACFLVYSRTVPVPPEEFGCVMLEARANDLSTNRRVTVDQNRRIADLNSTLQELRSNLASLQANVTELSARTSSLLDSVSQQQTQLQTQGHDIERNRADVGKLAKVLAPTTRLVKFQGAELESSEKMLDSLIEQYAQTSKIVGQNNQQIDSMITDLNASFAQVKTTLTQMQQKLATIR